jgi:hypothetical protein
MSPQKLTPAVSRPARLAIAGGVWTAVGIMLLTWAVGWLLHAPRPSAIALGVLGVGVGILVWRALFSGLASGNIVRILKRPSRECVFAFTAPKGWVITALMILLGAVLRHSALPKPLLAVPYVAIGTALFLASLNYYSHLARSRKGAPA